MSLSLDHPETRPEGLDAKTSFQGKKLFLRGDKGIVFEIPLTDFLSLAHYVLTNDDLQPKDPRLKFINVVKSMKKVKGWNYSQRKTARRLQASINPCW